MLKFLDHKSNVAHICFQKTSINVSNAAWINAALGWEGMLFSLLIRYGKIHGISQGMSFQDDGLQ